MGLLWFHIFTKFFNKPKFVYLSNLYDIFILKFFIQCFFWSSNHFLVFINFIFSKLKVVGAFVPVFFVVENELNGSTQP